MAEEYQPDKSTNIQEMPMSRRRLITSLWGSQLSPPWAVC